MCRGWYCTGCYPTRYWRLLFFFIIRKWMTPFVNVCLGHGPIQRRVVGFKFTVKKQIPMTQHIWRYHCAEFVFKSEGWIGAKINDRGLKQCLITSCWNVTLDTAHLSDPIFSALYCLNSTVWMMFVSVHRDSPASLFVFCFWRWSKWHVGIRQSKD